MPCLRMETTEGWLLGRNAELFARIDAVLCRVLQVPPNDSLIRLSEYPPHQLSRPAANGPCYSYIEVALFAGRSLDTKRALYAGLTQTLAELGVPAADVTIALIEVGLDNWGIRGGKPASDFSFGFPIEI